MGVPSIAGTLPTGTLGFEPVTPVAVAALLGSAVALSQRSKSPLSFRFTDSVAPVLLFFHVSTGTVMYCGPLESSYGSYDGFLIDFCSTPYCTASGPPFLAIHSSTWA